MYGRRRGILSYPITVSTWEYVSDFNGHCFLQPQSTCNNVQEIIIKTRINCLITIKIHRITLLLQYDIGRQLETQYTMLNKITKLF